MPWPTSLLNRDSGVLVKLLFTLLWQCFLLSYYYSRFHCHNTVARLDSLHSTISDCYFQVRWILNRSFFSSSFEPASYSLVGRLILNPNEPMILFNLLGLQRNSSKFEMNLPEIYLFSSPLLCLCVNFFCFVLFWKYQQIFPSIRTETHLFHWNIFHLLLFWISTLYRLRI